MGKVIGSVRAAACFPDTPLRASAFSAGHPLPSKAHLLPALAIRLLTLAALIQGVMLVASAGSGAATFHSDYQRTGRSQDAGPVGPGEIWTFQAGGSITASPVIAEDGTIYLAGTDGRLYAVAPDGAKKWEFVAEESLCATPSLDAAGRLYFGDLDGWIYSLLPDGSLRWKHRLAEGTDRRILGSPAVTPGGVSYVVAWNNKLYSLSPDGNVLWHTPLNGLPSNGPALDAAGNVYLACLDSGDATSLAVHKFDPSSSTPVWTAREPLGSSSNRIISTPAIDIGRNRLYLGACTRTAGLLIGVNLANGQVVFRKSFPKGILSSPAIREDGTVLVGCLDGRLYALEPDQGAERWVFQTGAPYIFGSPGVDRLGNTYIGDSDGTVYAISTSGQKLWHFGADSNIETAPVIHQGRLYVTSFDSRLYALGITSTQIVYFPQVADGVSGSARMRTELKFTNTGEDTTLQVEFVKSDGSPMALELNPGGSLSSTTVSLKKGQSLNWETSGTGPLQAGYVRLAAGPGVGAAAVLKYVEKYVEGETTMYETGIPCTSSFRELTLLVDGTGKRAMGVALVNTGEQDANLTLRLYDRDFELVAVKTAREILHVDKFPKGFHFARFAFEIFPEINTLGLTQGIVTVESDQPLAGATLCQNQDYQPDAAEKVTTLSVFPVIDGRPEAPLPAFEPQTFYLPQFADGTAHDLSVQSVLYFANLGSDAPTKIEFFTTLEGEPVEFQLLGLGQAARFEFTVKKGQTLRFETPGNGQLHGGYVRVTTSSGVRANLVYSYRYKASLILEATVPVSEGLSRSTLFLASRPGALNTALVLLNVGEQAADVTLHFYDKDGKLAVKLPLQTKLAPGRGIVNYVSELIDQAALSRIDGGVVVVVPSQPVAAVTLREVVSGLNFAGYRLSVMPVIPGAAVP